MTNEIHSESYFLTTFQGHRRFFNGTIYFLTYQAVHFDILYKNSISLFVSENL